MNEPSSTQLTWVHEVRARLETPGSTRLPENQPGKKAAVLVPLYINAGELWLTLTKRTDTMSNHAGQIAFPGGAMDPGENSWQTALRETEEEIGLAQDRVLRLGQLDEIYAEVSDFRIVPCVGAVPYPYEPVRNEAEIEEVFSIPLLAFADVKVIEDREVEWRGKQREVRVYHVGRHQVWGLTARMIQNLMRRLGIEPTVVEEAPPAPPA